MGGANAPAPVGGASDVPPQDNAPMPPADGGQEQGENGGRILPVGDDVPINGPEQQGATPIDGAADGNGQLDPGPMDEPMDTPDGGEGGEGGDDSTSSIIDQLSPDDREAVRAYAQSMLSREEDNPENSGDAAGGPDGGAPMMESVVFTKKQLNKIHENLAITEPEKDVNKTEKKRGKSLSNKSPFKSPKFN